MKKSIRKRYPYTDSLWCNPATEPDWHALRRDDVTATDAAALFGVSPYSTLFELYHTKAGALSSTFEETERMRWGKRLQDAIARGICEDHGWRIVNASPFLYVRSPSFTGMGASPDYIVFDEKRGIGLLEIKNVDSFVARREWVEDEAPVHIEFQVQHQLECAGLPWGAIGGLIGGNRAHVIVRDRDTDVGAEIGSRVTDLWRRIRDQDPPSPDFLADFDAIKRLYRDANVGAVLQPDDATRARLLALCAAERSAAAAEKTAEEDRKRAQAEILTLVGDYERVDGLDGFGLSAVTIHREARVQEVRASSYRLLKITTKKPAAAAAH